MTDHDEEEEDASSSCTPAREMASSGDYASGPIACSSTLSFLFADDLGVAPPLPSLSDDAGAIALRVLPGMTTLVVLGATERRRSGRRFHATQRRVAAAVGAGALLVQSALAWRTSELLRCDEGVTGVDVGEWFVVVVPTSLLLLCAYVLLVLAPSSPRVAYSFFLLLVAGAAFAEWALGGGVVTSFSGSLLLAAQHAFGIAALSCAYHLPDASSRAATATISAAPKRQGAAARKGSTVPMEQVDPTSTRSRSTPLPLSSPPRGPGASGGGVGRRWLD